MPTLPTVPKTRSPFWSCGAAQATPVASLGELPNQLALDPLSLAWSHGRAQSPPILPMEPLDRAFGIGSLEIQTAGMSGTTQTEQDLVVLEDPEAVYGLAVRALRRFPGAMGPTTAEIAEEDVLRALSRRWEASTTGWSAEGNGYDELLPLGMGCCGRRSPTCSEPSIAASSTIGQLGGGCDRDCKPCAGEAPGRRGAWTRPVAAVARRTRSQPPCECRRTGNGHGPRRAPLHRSAHTAASLDARKKRQYPVWRTCLGG